MIFTLKKCRLIEGADDWKVWVGGVADKELSTHVGWPCSQNAAVQDQQWVSNLCTNFYWWRIPAERNKNILIYQLITENHNLNGFPTDPCHRWLEMHYFLALLSVWLQASPSIDHLIFDKHIYWNFCFGRCSCLWLLAIGWMDKQSHWSQLMELLPCNILSV